MHPNVFSPEQMERLKSVMTPEMIKQTTDSINNMSDEDLQRMMNMTGMGNGMSPQMFRNMSRMTQGMNPNEMAEKMKNIPSWQYQNMFNRMNMNQNTGFNNNTFKTYNEADETRGTLLQRLNKSKARGNDFFRNGDYRAAVEKYYQVINAISEVSDLDRNAFGPQLDELENVCRLNSAACRLKTGDNDTAINECNTVLKKKKCFKAYFRLGCAYLNKNEFQKALTAFEQATAIGNDNEKKDTEKYLGQCREGLEKIQKEKKEREEKEAREREKKEKEAREREIKEKEAKTSSQPKNEGIKKTAKEWQKEEETNPKLKAMREAIEKENEKGKEYSEKREAHKDDIKVESEVRPSTINTTTTSSSSSQSIPTFNNPMAQNPGSFEQAANYFQNLVSDKYIIYFSLMKNLIHK